MLERFAPSAIFIILRAQQEASRQRHNYVGPEQVLLALIDNEERRFTTPGLEQPLPSLAAKVFEKYGATLEAARKKADPLDTSKSFVPVEIPFTTSCKRLLERSWALADEFSDSEIDTEHLLIALIDDEEGAAHEVLTALHLEKHGLREEALRLRAERRSAQ